MARATGVTEESDRPAHARLIVDGLKKAGVSIVTALPDSLLRPVYEMVATDRAFRYVLVANEAELPGIAAGAYLGGKRAVMFMENSGLRQACEPLARFAFSHEIPLVLMMSYRGDFGEQTWWGHSHGLTMRPLLETLRVPYRIVRRLEDIEPSIRHAVVHADSGQYPTALVFAGECLGRPRQATG